MWFCLVLCGFVLVRLIWERFGFVVSVLQGVVSFLFCCNCFVWFCMALCDFVRFCMDLYGFVMVLTGFVWVCMVL